MKTVHEWLGEKLRYDDVEESLGKVLSFYGDKYGEIILSSDISLLLNDKKAKKALGTFCAGTNEITLNQVKGLLGSKQLDCVFVHEMAHFLDHERRSRNSRYRFASSQFGKKERVIADLFRSKMIPVPQKRTNYRGRTCELFARAIEEYYGLLTENKNWIRESGSFDYYVNITDFKKVLFPIIQNYFTEI